MSDDEQEENQGPECGTDPARPVEGEVSLLEALPCPNCPDQGWYEVVTTGTEAGCCGRPSRDGSCCGNAIPVPVPVLEQEQCRFCWETPDSVFNVERSNAPLTGAATGGKDEHR